MEKSNIPAAHRRPAAMVLILLNLWTRGFGVAMGR